MLDDSGPIVSNTTGCFSTSMSTSGCVITALLSCCFYILAFFIMSSVASNGSAAGGAANLSNWKELCSEFFRFGSEICGACCFCFSGRGNGSDNSGDLDAIRSNVAASSSRATARRSARGGGGSTSASSSSSRGGGGGVTGSPQNAIAMTLGSGSSNSSRGGGFRALAANDPQNNTSINADDEATSAY